ncbi:MAG: hypothetical protein ACJ8GN_07680 [Longimicrobiaceae bacterium]
MRRAAAFFFLLVFGLAQAAATECPMGSAAGSGAPVRHAAHHHQSSEHGDAHHPAHAPASCGIVTSCGATVVPVPHAAVVQPPVYRAGPLARLPHLYLSPVLAIDSPPPRATLQA